jgi:acetolactate synthase-1/2/3 large subunit
MGMLGMHGKSVANQAISDSDLLIIIGARVSDRAVLLPANVSQNTKIVHIDIDPAEIGKNLSTFVPVVGDAKEILNQILDTDPARKSNDWPDLLQSKKEALKLDYAPRNFGINPKAFVNLLSKSLPEDHIYCADVGQNQIWSAANCEVRSGRFLTSGGMGTMGYSIPAAIGAKLADPEKTVVAVCGDGSFQMSMMELATICQNNVDVKIVVMKNNKLGLVKEIQKKSYKNNEMAVDLSGSPDLVSIARAYGIPSHSVDNMEAAEKAVAELIRCKGPYLLECIVDENESSL